MPLTVVNTTGCWQCNRLLASYLRYMTFLPLHDHNPMKSMYYLYRLLPSRRHMTKSARSFLSMLILFRIHEPDAQFAHLQFQQFPQSSRDPKLLCKDT